jgi:hypothetical protein
LPEGTQKTHKKLIKEKKSMDQDWIQGFPLINEECWPLKHNIL